MAHPWFKNVDWENVIADREQPPFVPARDINAASQNEIGNFNDEYSKKTRNIKFDEPDELCFEDWDWTNPKAYSAEILEFLIKERAMGRPLVPAAMDGDCCCCCAVS